MIKTKAHLNNEGLDQIRKIRAGMNKSRSSKNYIKLFFSLISRINLTFRGCLRCT